MFGAIDRVGTVAAIAAFPVAVWELSLGIYLVVKGFRPSPILTAGLPPLPPVPPAVPSQKALPVS
jgi:hypothetical protein